MKFCILIFVIVFSLSYNYDANKAVDYANKYCSNYSKEIDFDSFTFGDGSGSDFVTDCLIAGGFDTSQCLTDDNGSISTINNLSSCLTQKGWKSSTTIPKKFKAGYPVLVGQFSYIATEVEEGIVKYSSTSFFSVCNGHLGSIVGYEPLYFYLE